MNAVYISLAAALLAAAAAFAYEAAREFSERRFSAGFFTVGAATFLLWIAGASLWYLLC